MIIPGGIGLNGKLKETEREAIITALGIRNGCVVRNF